MRLTVSFNIGGDQLEYLDACARIRSVHRMELVQKIVGHVLRDQIVAAVLDDEGKTHKSNGGRPPIDCRPNPSVFEGL